MAQPSMVKTRYALAGTPALASRARNAATPAFVCVSTRTGSVAPNPANASVISWVLPHPAGATTAPREMSRRASASGTASPRANRFKGGAQARPGQG